MSQSKFAFVPGDPPSFIVQPSPSRSSWESASDFNILGVNGMSTIQEIKLYLSTFSLILFIWTRIQKMQQGTKPLIELTSSQYKNEIEAKEKVTMRKKPVMDLKKVKIEKGLWKKEDCWNKL